MRKINILFVCSGNIFRSLSAETICNKYINEHSKFNYISSSSAGITAREQQPRQRLIENLNKLDIDISKHIQRKLTQEIIDEQDIIIAIAENHQEFIKDNFGIDVPLFNEIAINKSIGILDIDDVVTDFSNDIDGVNKHIDFIVDYIQKNMPKLINNLENFI